MGLTPVCSSLQLFGQPEEPFFPEAFQSREKKRAGRKHRVVVVDDERLIADTVVEILNLHGFDAKAVYDGKGALREIEQLCPDTVISDVVMPGLNGIEVAKFVKVHCPETRVMLLSGQASTTDLLDRARGEGYDFEMLTKPMHPEELILRIRTRPR